MGIYIKGMEMPKDCYECDDSFLLIAIGCECCKWFPNERPSECPLTEVSEPHGRLIDADSIMQYFNVYKYEEWTSAEVSELINNALTIIESEVEE